MPKQLLDKIERLTLKRHVQQQILKSPRKPQMQNMPLNIYIDTSVVGGTFDEVFAKLTAPFWKAVVDEEIIILVSDLLEEELQRAPQHIKEFLPQLPKSQIRKVFSTPEINELADRYIKEKVVGKTSRNDCRHIAIATFYQADALVSWNFKHIVNRNRILGYNRINQKLGYSIIDIRTPSEVINYDKNSD